MPQSIFDIQMNRQRAKRPEAAKNNLKSLEPFHGTNRTVGLADCAKRLEVIRESIHAMN